MGNVALKSITWRSLDTKFKSSSIVGVNSGERSLSASSITTVTHSLRSRTSFLARSAIRPGVPTMIWTASFSRMISSFKPVPPVVTMTLIPKNLPNVLQTCDVCKASSRVGTRIRACVFEFFASIFSRVGMRNAAVFPVPFFALASMSRPVRATGIVSSWMGEGLSNPAPWIPFIRSRWMTKSSHSSPFVFVTSCRTGQIIYINPQLNCSYLCLKPCVFIDRSCILTFFFRPTIATKCEHEAAKIVYRRRQT